MRVAQTIAFGGGLLCLGFGAGWGCCAGLAAISVCLAGRVCFASVASEMALDTSNLTGWGPPQLAQVAAVFRYFTPLGVWWQLSWLSQIF